MTNITLQPLDMTTVITWLMDNYGGPEHNGSWDMPIVTREEIPTPPEVYEQLIKYDPNFKNLGTIKTTMTIHNDTLAAIIKLKFVDLIIN